MVFVTNHAPRLHTIALNGTGSTIMLAPGVNRVSAEAWEIAKRNPGVQRALALRGLEATEPANGADLPALSGVQACDLVALTFDRKLLADFKAIEKRSSVLAAIELQIAELDARDKADAELAGTAKAKDSQ